MLSHAVAMAAISRRPRMNANYRNALVAVALLGLARPAAADVICDWNAKALDFIVSHKMLPPPAERIVAMTQLAMFDAVNSIDRKYRPLSGAACGGADRLQRGRGGGGRGNGARWSRSADPGPDKSRPCGLSRRHCPTVPPSPRASSSAKRSRPRSWRRAPTTAPTRRTPIGRGPRPASTCRPRPPRRRNGPPSSHSP